MQPLPTTPENLPAMRTLKAEVAASRTIELGAGPGGPPSNQRRAACATQRAYPVLLVLSTLMAAVFCALYLSKPVIVRGEAAAAPAATPAAVDPDAGTIQPLAPAPEALPGDEAERPQTAAPAQIARDDGDSFEETNLRIQHVLSAAGPAGQDLGRIVLDVPVLYQSGRIRWTQEDVARARSLLTRIGDYQQRARALRDEAIVLISEWDQLTVESIPEPALRADSPTLPENQGLGTAEVSTLKTSEAIEIDKP